LDESAHGRSPPSSGEYASSVIDGYFSDGRFQDLHQVLNCLLSVLLLV
jgi:hypothetical protein